MNSPLEIFSNQQPLTECRLEKPLSMQGCPVCGNGACESGENSSNCPGDCPVVCGNGICRGGEVHDTCSADCPSGMKDGICDRIKDGVCDPDCGAGQDQDCNQPPLGAVTIAFAAILLIVLVIAYKRGWLKKSK